MTWMAVILSSCGVSDAAQINEAAGMARGNKPIGLICIAPVTSAAIITPA
jgi:enhancing lycopene biosynthesis protein 2